MCVRVSVSVCTRACVRVRVRAGIAFAVSRALVELGARTLFATHYRQLGDAFRGDARVTCAHMGCIVGGVSDAGVSDAATAAAASAAGGGEGFFPALPAPPTVVFTYRFVPGVATSSFGLNVARLARLPAEVLARCLLRCARPSQQRAVMRVLAVLLQRCVGIGKFRGGMHPACNPRVCDRVDELAVQPVYARRARLVRRVERACARDGFRCEIRDPCLMALCAARHILEQKICAHVTTLNLL